MRAEVPAPSGSPRDFRNLSALGPRELREYAGSVGVDSDGLGKAERVRTIQIYTHWAPTPSGLPRGFRNLSALGPHTLCLPKAI